MPKVYTEKHKLRLPQSHGRTVGLHVSEVIRDLAFAGGYLDKKYKKEAAIEDQDTGLMQVGLAWEDYLEKSNQHPEIEYHPGELRVPTNICAICGSRRGDHDPDDNHKFVRLNVYMSPDGFTSDDTFNMLCLNEVKFTKKSCRDFAIGLRMGSKKSIMYIWQIAAYLRGLNGLLVARLHVLFINGNYTFSDTDPEGGTVYMIFRLEFSQSEIDTIWGMIENHAQEMVRNGKYKHAA